MTNYITDLFDLNFWELLFSTSFFLGLLLTLFIIFAASMSGDSDADTGTDHSLDHDTDLSVDHDMDLSVDHDMDLDMDHDVDLSIDHDMDLSMDHDIDLDLDHDIADITVAEMYDVELIRDKSYTLKSNFAMGNISIFFLFFGQIGWLYLDTLSDMLLIISLAVGYVASKAFSYVISNYAKTVIVPIAPVQKGDIARVIYSVSPDKPGLVHVLRRDGSTSSVMAVGVFPHDNFAKNEQGYVVGKKQQFYLITKGTSELRKQPQVKKGKKIINQI